VVRAPRIDLVAIATGTWQWAIVPPQCVDVGLTLFGAEELVDIGESRHG
jgi:hypothetical protein